MEEPRCPECGGPFRFRELTQSHRLNYLHAESGILIVVDGEAVVHRCPGLTREDEQLLLQDLQWVLDNPDSEE